MPGPKFTGNLALRSGMTANVTINTNQVQGVLRVPNAALRFNPSAFIKDDKKTEGPRLGQPMVMGGQRPAGGAQSGTGSKGGTVTRREDRIWVLEKGKPKAIVVKAGISDGQFTEVSGEGLSEGLQVLVGVESNKQTSGSPAPLTGTQGGRR
jgi:HlyD family secretion protein